MYVMRGKYGEAERNGLMGLASYSQWNLKPP
jgi:hypothetical protein